MTDLTVIILTYNEEQHIERAILSVKDVANDIIVVDSSSTDRTVDIAKALGARVFQNRFVNQAKQFAWAMTHCEIQSQWTMRLDADEYIESDLAKEIGRQLVLLASSITGINLKRKHIFMGRWIRYGGRYPVLMLRIWRTGKAKIEDRWMDEHLYVTEGSTITLNGGFVDHNLNSLTHFIDKHNRYATREAIETIISTHKLKNDSPIIDVANSSVQVGFKRVLKKSLYDRLPFPMSATLYFLYRYFVRCGFLDGLEGAVYHFLQGYWYRFLVGAKTRELERGLKGIDKEADILARLAALTGVQVVCDQKGSNLESSVAVPPW